jgi:sugar phosphate isomerase/epimerase
MQFNYSHSMDREYFPMSAGTGTVAPLPSEHKIEKPIFATDEIGTSIADKGGFKANLHAAIRAGASQVELSGGIYQGEPGVGSDAVSMQDRQELKEIAKVSGVKLISVHTPSQIGNVSGLGQQGFSEAQREQSMNEVKKTMDFSADISDGGAIVVHTGEFPRSMYDKWDGQFELHINEEEKAVHHLVDPKTGNLIKSVREDEEIWRPKYRKDANGNKIPVKRPDGAIVKDFFEEEVYDIERNDRGDMMVDKIKFSDFRKDFNNTGEAAKEFFRLQQTAEAEHVLGQAQEYENMYKKSMDRRTKLLDALSNYKKLYEDVPEDERWRHQVIVPDGRTYGNLVPPDVKDPVKYLEEEITENEKSIAYAREIALSGRKNAHKLKQLVDDVTTIDNYGLQKSTDSFARLGIYAMDTTKTKRLSNDMFVAPENIFPEMGYGAHPKEMIELVKKSRIRMTEILQKEWGMSEDQAKREASQHIKATFDTEHLGLWRKHFKSNTGESQEQTDKRFYKWYKGIAREMADSGVVGHLHLADGFGRGHANLPVGAGMHPVREAAEYFKEKGYSGTLISEGYAAPGGQLRQLGDAWAYFGSPVTGFAPGGPSASAAGNSWTNIRESYFGQAQPPQFVYGGYAPSQEYLGAPFWSGVPLE